MAYVPRYKNGPEQVFVQQADAVLNQAAPVVNTWYTVLNTVNARVYCVAVSIAATGETLEGRVTVDGVVVPAAVGLAFAAGDERRLYIAPFAVAGVVATRTTFGSNNSVLPIAIVNGFIDARTIVIEVRKTTVAGVGTLTAVATYARRE